MPITDLDHIYLETREWSRDVAFWEGLGFGLSEEWGREGHRAGRLTAGHASVVLAEVDPATQPAMSIFFRLEDADAFSVADDATVLESLTETHWGTRWIRVADSEGRVFSLEEKPEE